MWGLVVFTFCVPAIDQCFSLSDLEGPYATQEACQARADDIVNRREELAAIFSTGGVPGPFLLSVECGPVGEPT